MDRPNRKARRCTRLTGIRLLINITPPPTVALTIDNSESPTLGHYSENLGKVPSEDSSAKRTKQFSYNLAVFTEESPMPHIHIPLGKFV